MHRCRIEPTAAFFTMTFDTEPTVFCIHKAVPVLPLLIIEESAILTEPPLILTVAIVSDVAAAPKTCVVRHDKVRIWADQ